VPVISVRELEPDAMRRELALVKVDAEDPASVSAVADMYDATAVDSSPETATFEITGSRQKIEAAVDTFSQFGIREVSRTGLTAMARGTDQTAGADLTAQPADEANYSDATQPADDD